MNGFCRLNAWLTVLPDTPPTYWTLPGLIKGWKSHIDKMLIRCPSSAGSAFVSRNRNWNRFGCLLKQKPNLWDRCWCKKEFIHVPWPGRMVESCLKDNPLFLLKPTSLIGMGLWPCPFIFLVFRMLGPSNAGYGACTSWWAVPWNLP